jgi:hypothetical protein
MARLALGDFVEATPVSAELFGQNVFVTSRQGRNVAQMHTLTWPCASDYDLTSNTIQPFGGKSLLSC